MRLLSGVRWLVICLLLLQGCGGARKKGTRYGTVSIDATVVGGVTGNTLVNNVRSVSIDGVKYTVPASASVKLESDPQAPTPGTIADVMGGRRVEAQVDASNNISSILVRPTLVAPVEDIRINTSGQIVQLVAGGQTVQFVLSGTNQTLRTGGTLALGDMVNVHGVWSASGDRIVARRVERQAGGSQFFGTGTGRRTVTGRVSGKVSNANLGSFSIHGLTVYFDPTTQMLPPWAPVYNGAMVDVSYGTITMSMVDWHLNPTTMVASALQMAPPSDINPSPHLVIGGEVYHVTNSGRSFTLNGLAIDAASATYSGPTGSSFATLTDGTFAVVTGTVVSAETRSVKATKVVVPAAQDLQTSLYGQISNFNSTADFEIGGTPVDASNATVEGGTLSDLRNDVIVQALGEVSGTKVVLTYVRIIAST